MPSYICRSCAQPFTAAALTKGRPRTYCSRTCMSADYRARLTGDGNPAWRGKRWGYKGQNWAKSCATIIARDGACADCGTAEKLVVHHLIPQRFWLDLAAANTDGNLVVLCNSCHVKRPEHYWVEMPDAVFDSQLHSRLPPERFRARLRKKPACLVCGQPCRQHRNSFCSYSCATRSRWVAGVYTPERMAANFGDPATARWGRKKIA